MLMAQEIFCFAISLTILLVSVLSIANIIGGCWWSISVRDVLVAVAFWQFSNNPPNYTSVDDDITFLIMLHSTCTGTFSGGIDCISVLNFGPGKKYPPALLCASSSEM